MALIIAGDFAKRVQDELAGQVVHEVDVHKDGDSESASGADEVEITLGNGRTLLVYARGGDLHVEID